MTVLLEPEATPDNDRPFSGLSTANEDLRVGGTVNVLINGTVRSHTIYRLTRWQVITEEGWYVWWRDQLDHERGEHVHHPLNRMLIH